MYVLPSSICISSPAFCLKFFFRTHSFTRGIIGDRLSINRTITYFNIYLVTLKF